MKLLQVLGQLLLSNIAAVLFLLGLVVLNVATYIAFDYVVGLFVTGFTVLLVAIVLASENVQRDEE